MKVAVLARGDYSLVNRRVSILRELGVQVFFISLNSHDAEHRDNYHVKSWGVRGLRYIFAVPKIIKLIKRLDPDVVDCHGASSYGIFSWFLKPPLVISIYGPDLYDHGLKNKLTEIFITKTLNNASLLSCSSNSLHNYLKPYAGVRGIKTAIVPYGVDDIVGLESRRRIVREELGLNDKNYVFIHTRRFMEFWRVEKIIEAFIVLNQKNAKLLFIFPEPNEKEALLLSRLKSMLDLKEKLGDVFFFQDVPYDKFMSYQCAADCFVCIGKNDLFANSLIEAMVAENSLILNEQEAYLLHLEGLPVEWVKDSESSAEIASLMKRCSSEDRTEKYDEVERLHEYAVTELSANAAAKMLVREYQTLIEER